MAWFSYLGHSDWALPAAIVKRCIPSRINQLHFGTFGKEYLQDSLLRVIDWMTGLGTVYCIESSTPVQQRVISTTETVRPVLESCIGIQIFISYKTRKLSGVIRRNCFQCSLIAKNDIMEIWNTGAHFERCLGPLSLSSLIDVLKRTGHDEAAAVQTTSFFAEYHRRQPIKCWSRFFGSHLFYFWWPFESNFR